MSNHASVLVDMSILMIVTVDGSQPRSVRASKVSARQSKKTQRYAPLGLAPEEDLDRNRSMAMILEKEIFAFLADQPGVERKAHASGVKSEVVVNLSRDVLKSLFNHLIDPTSTPKGPSQWMPQLKSAYFFDEELALQGQVEPPERFRYIVNLDPSDEQRRRVLQQELKVARKKKQDDRAAELEEQLLKLADNNSVDSGGLHTTTDQDTGEGGGGDGAIADDNDSTQQFDLGSSEMNDPQLQASIAVIGAPIPVQVVQEILGRVVTRGQRAREGMALRSARVIPNAVFEALNMF